jgi:tyrosine-protein phosphatase YwqE
LYPNTPETILPKLDELKQALQQQNIPVQIEAAAEYMVDADFEDYIQKGKPLLTFGENNILIEMSYVSPSANIEQVIFHLRMKGLQPVLAHPERYNYYHKNFEKYERLKDLGCIFQINLLSLSGYYGKMVKITAEKLMKNRMIQLAGTDLHHQRHIDALKQLIKVENVYNLLLTAQLKNNLLL